MTHSRYQFDILAHIVRKPHISQQELCEIFSKKYRHSYMLFPIAKNKKEFDFIAFYREINLMKDEGLILFMIHGSDYEGWDKEYPHHHTTTLSEYDIDSLIYFIATEKGDAVFERYIRESVMFWIPWGVTTLIALASLITDLLPLIVR